MRVSGPETRSLAARLFHSTHALEPKIATYGTVVDENGATLDRGIAILSIAPHSYTGEDTLELQIHGSPTVSYTHLDVYKRQGLRSPLPLG